MPGNATPLEIVWTVTGLVGTINCVWLLLDVRRQKRKMDRDGVNGADRLIVTEALGVKWFLVGINAIILATGAVAVALPPALPQRPTTTFGAVVIGGLLGIATLANGMGWWFRVRRKMLRRYLGGRLLASAGIPDGGEGE